MFINDFYIFIKDNHIITTAVATIFSRIITDLSYCFIENILLPIIKIDYDNDGKADIDNLENKIIIFNGIKIKLGKFIIEIIKFLCITIILYYITKLNSYTK